MNKIYSKKQLALMQIWQQHKLKRINLLEGSVRSGKTWISLVLWAFWVASMPINGNYLMVAKTLTSLKRNCLDLLQTLVGRNNFTYSLSKKEGRLFGRLIYLEGVNDARAESKIRGMTLQGAYCDELTLFTEDFFSMLLSRLSEKDAKLISTTNPDNPNHWLMEKYIKRQNELSMLVMKFLIDDNTFLDKDYIEELKKEYTGVFYKRFILGLWVVAAGAVYDMFDDKKHIVNSFIDFTDDENFRYVSCDYGTQNPTTFLLWDKTNKGKWICTKEYYYSGRDEKRQKTNSEYVKDLKEFLGDIKVRAIIVDPSATSFIAELKKAGFIVKQAKNDVIEGIRTVGTLLIQGDILFCDTCVNTIKEFRSYVWDSKAADKGEDKPVKQNDHAMDAVRYFCYTILRTKSGIRILK